MDFPKRKDLRGVEIRNPVTKDRESGIPVDPANKQRVLDIIFEYVREKETTLVIVTHDHELLTRFDRVIDFKEFHGGPGAANETPRAVAPEGTA